jgi:hypothetical protein
LREAEGSIAAAGGQVIGVGMGTPARAAELARAERLPFPLLVDPGQDLYRALGARRMTPMDLLRPAVLTGALRAFRHGHRQTGVEADPRQLGAVAVVDRQGDVRALRHIADQAAIEWIREAIRDHS